MSKMPRFLAALLSVVLGLAALTPQANAQDAKPQQAADIGIGTWNIEFLGAAPHLRRDTPPRTDEDLQLIGRKLRELSVAVLGVQEICGEAPMQKVAKAAGDNWAFVLGTTGSWNDGKTQQGVGFFYDNDVVELLHAEELLDFPSERDGFSVFHRKPVTACFRHRATRCDFRVVVVHMKAGRKGRDREKRRLEATTLREWLNGLRNTPGEDPDIVLLGDFNCTYGDLPEQILEKGGDLQYIDQKSAVPTILHFDSALDQIVVARGFAELQRTSRIVHHVSGKAERLAWRRTYSDHFPVTVTLRASSDDDADATFRRGPSTQFLPVSRRPKSPATASNGKAFTVGSTVTVYAKSTQFTGVLLRPLPEGSGGWVVLKTDTGTRAVPVHEVRWITQ